MAVLEGNGTIGIQSAFSGNGNLWNGVSGVVSIAHVLSGTIRKNPNVQSALAVGPNTVRVTFDQAMAKNSNLINVSNYAISSIGIGVPIYISGVTAEDVSYPTYVDLTVNEMTDGEDYSVEVNSATYAPVGRWGLYLNPFHNTASFTGVGQAPTIEQIAAIGLNRVDVTFDEVMKDNSDIRDPGRYSFDNGLSVLSVLGIEGATVQLVTSDQTPGELYTLTIVDVAAAMLKEDSGNLLKEDGGKLLLE